MEIYVFPCQFKFQNNGGVIPIHHWVLHHRNNNSQVFAREEEKIHTWKIICCKAIEPPCADVVECVLASSVSWFSDRSSQNRPRNAPSSTRSFTKAFRPWIVSSSSRAFLPEGISTESVCVSLIHAPVGESSGLSPSPLTSSTSKSISTGTLSPVSISIDPKSISPSSQVICVRKENIKRWLVCIAWAPYAETDT